jgi:hypothetical protein
MRKSLVPLALMCTALIACSNPATTGMLIDDFGSFNGAKVELTEQGGIAALSSTRVVRHDDRSFSYAQRRICSTSCAAPLDSASGALSPAATDSLFTIIFAASPYQLKDDYGTTRNSADMVSYSLRFTSDRGVKTIRADDGTMPPQMRRIVEGVHGTISAARQ